MIRMAVLCLGAAAMTSPSAWGEEKFMSQAELMRLFPGATISHVSPRSGQSVTINFLPGGSITGSAGSRRDTGKWWASGNGALCFQFKSLEKGQRICHLLARHGNQLVRYRVKDRQPKTGINWTVVKGGGG